MNTIGVSIADSTLSKQRATAVIAAVDASASPVVRNACSASRDMFKCESRAECNNCLHRRIRE